MHGFRATLRTWAQEKKFAWEIAEQILAHDIVGDTVQKAYIRAQAFEGCKALLDAWATYAEGGTVIPFKVAP
jgi:hypothetical protein